MTRVSNALVVHGLFSLAQVGTSDRVRAQRALSTLRSESRLRAVFVGLTVRPGLVEGFAAGLSIAVSTRTGRTAGRLGISTVF